MALQREGIINIFAKNFKRMEETKFSYLPPEANVYKVQSKSVLCGSLNSVNSNWESGYEEVVE